MQAPKLTKDIYKCVIVPNGIEGDNLQFSLCLELNPDNDRIGDNSTDLTVADWRQDVRRYLRPDNFKGANAWRTELIQAIVAKDAIKVAVNGIEPKYYTAALKAPSSIPEHVTSMWEEFLNLDVGGAPKSVPKRMSKQWVKTRDIDVVEESGSSSLVIDKLSDKSPEDVLKLIRGSSRINGLSALSVDEREGIQRAFNRHKDEIESILTSLKTNTTKKYKTGDDPGTRAHNTLLLVEDINTEMALTPEFVIEAHSLLCSSPNLKRVFGTTLDFFITGFTVPENAPFKVELVLPPLLEEYFDIRNTRMEILHLGTGRKPVLVAAPTQKGGYSKKYFEKSVMTLPEGKHRIFSFDPQAAAKAADEAHEYLAKLPDNKRTSKIGDLEQGVRELKGAVSITASHDDRKKVLATLKEVGKKGEQGAIIRRLNNQITDLSTQGHALYAPKHRWVDDDKDDDEEDDGKPPVMEHGLVRGYVVYVRSVENGKAPKWMSLTRVREELKWDSGQVEKPVDAELGIHIGGGVHHTSESGKGKNAKEEETTQLYDGFLFSWDGTSLSTRNPMGHIESEGDITGTQELVNRMDALGNAIDNTTPEITALQFKSKELFGVDWFPFKNPGKGQAPKLLVKRSDTEENREVKLRFGKDVKYEYLVAAQYHNGYVPLECMKDVGIPEEIIAKCKSQAEPFLRQEHIKEVFVALGKNIYRDDAQKELKREHPGESPSELVVRTGTILSNSECVRYILPPPIPSFQLYLWYSHTDLANISNGRTMSLPQLTEWYRRSSCDAKTEEGFQANIRRCKERNDIIGEVSGENHGCAFGCRRFCGGVQQPPTYRRRLNYLPDPVVTGFVIEFFLDKECYIPAPIFETQVCKYTKGRYPDLKPWALVLHKFHKGEGLESFAEKDEDQYEIRVHLQEGVQVYARVIPTYDANHAHFEEALIEIVPSAGKEDAGDPLYDLRYANAKVLTLTHAVQRPLFDPVIKQITIHRFNDKFLAEGKYEPAGTIRVDVNLYMEHLNVFYGVGIPGSTPSGELELYALWNEYGERKLEPVKSIEEKRDRRSPNGGLAPLQRLVFESRDGQPQNQPIARDQGHVGESHSYWTTITFRAESGTFDHTHFTDAVFKVRNSSKFHCYFHLGPMPAEASEAHVRWSNEYKLSDKQPRVLFGDVNTVRATFIPNNLKPNAPSIRKIVPLIVDDVEDKGRERIAQGDRVRIYLEPNGRMLTGANERVGILVRYEHGMYNTLFSEYASKAGRDVITDGSGPDASPALHHDRLSPLELELDPRILEPDYIERFQPQFDGDVFRDPDAIGLVSYIPQYDEHQGLWYFDPQFRLRNMDGQELHNAFIQLGLVGYQPWSANYNVRTEGNTAPDDRDHAECFELDKRLSAPVKADFFSIYPSREFRDPYVLFRNDEGRFSLGGSISSLFFQEFSSAMRCLHSQFILGVQERRPGGFWTSYESSIRSLEFELDGAIVAERYDASIPLKGQVMEKHFHCLLPPDLGIYLQGEAPTRSRFSCSFDLDFDPGFLRRRQGGRYRVVIYEVEWFNYEEPISKLGELLADDAEPGQIPGVRIKGVNIFE